MVTDFVLMLCLALDTGRLHALVLPHALVRVAMMLITETVVGSGELRHMCKLPILN